MSEAKAAEWKQQCVAVQKSVKESLICHYGKSFVTDGDDFENFASLDPNAFSASWFLKSGGHGKFCVLINRSGDLKIKFTRNLIASITEAATELPKKAKPDAKLEDFATLCIYPRNYRIRRHLELPYTYITFSSDTELQDSLKDAVSNWVNTLLWA